MRLHQQKRQQSQFARSRTEDGDGDEDDVTLVMRPGQQSPVRQAGPDDDERYCLIRHPALHTAGCTLSVHAPQI